MTFLHQQAEMFEREFDWHSLNPNSTSDDMRIAMNGRAIADFKHISIYGGSVWWNARRQLEDWNCLEKSTETNSIWASETAYNLNISAPIARA